MSRRVLRIVAVLCLTTLAMILSGTKIMQTNNPKHDSSAMEGKEPVTKWPEIELREVQVSFRETSIDNVLQQGIRFDVICWVGATPEKAEVKVDITFSKELEALLGTDGTAAFSISTSPKGMLVSRTLEVFSPRIAMRSDFQQPLYFTVNGYCNDQIVLRQGMRCDMVVSDTGTASALTEPKEGAETSTNEEIGK